MAIAVERVDAIVVGGRCAGAATAIALARTGRRVVVLDQAHFPSDTLSTHLLFPAGLAEVQALGALDRVRALGAPEHRDALVGGAGFTGQASYSPHSGIAHGMCVRRVGFDAALVDTARQLLLANVTPSSGHRRSTTGSTQKEENLWVYGREGLPCRRCATPIRSQKHAADGRVSFWCPACQKTRDSHPISSALCRK